MFKYTRKLYDHEQKVLEKHQKKKKCDKTNTKITIKHGGNYHQSEKSTTHQLENRLKKSPSRLQQAKALLDTYIELDSFANEEDDFDDY